MREAVKVPELHPIPTPGATDQRLTVDSTAAGVQFVDSYNSKSKFVIVDVQDADVMMTIDGSAPTSSNGHRLNVGEKYEWSLQWVRAAKFIRQGSTSGTLHLSEVTT